MAPGVLEQVRELVQSGCRASQELERKGGIQVRCPAAHTPPGCRPISVLQALARQLTLLACCEVRVQFLCIQRRTTAGVTCACGPGRGARAAQVLEVMGRDVEKLGGHSCATVRPPLRPQCHQGTTSL